MNREPITTIEQLRALPAFPTIGSILNKFTSAIGGKEFPKGTSSLKRRLQLLSNESPEVDFDSYIDVLNATLESYKLVSQDLAFHWIDEAQLYHYFRSYQQLVINFPVLGLTDQLIQNLTAYYFAFMSVQRYTWMVCTFEKETKLHTPHFLVSGNASLREAFGSIIKNAKRLLGKPQMTDWKLITLLRPELMGDKDKGIGQNKTAISELVSQMQSWGRTPDSPKYYTFLEKIINPLRAIDENAAGILEVDFVSWKWLAAMLRDSDLSFSSLSKWLFPHFNLLLTSNEIMDFQAPSDFIIPDEDLKFRIQALGQALLADFCTDNEYYLWQNTSQDLKIILPEIENTETDLIWEFLNALAYCSGPDFEEYSNTYFKYCLEKRSPDIKYIFRKQFLHGLKSNSYSSSTAWIDRQTEPLLHGLPSKIDRGQLAKWMAATNAKNINRPKKWGRYYRTRLMMAVTYKDADVVRQFLDLGADPLWISRNSSKQPGDNASAMLFALQKMNESYTSDDFKGSRRVVAILLQSLKNLPEQNVRDCLSLPLNLKKESPLSAALYSGRLDIINEMLLYKPDLQTEIGSDSLFPIYAAVNLYFEIKMLMNKDGKITDLFKKGNFNKLRMIMPPKFIQLLEEGRPDLTAIIESQIKQKQCFLHTDETTIHEIIRLLARAGAPINKMSPNGRYPLDLAIEISEKYNDPSVIKVLREIGEYKRALL